VTEENFWTAFYSNLGHDKKIFFGQTFSTDKKPDDKFFSFVISVDKTIFKKIKIHLKSSFTAPDKNQFATFAGHKIDNILSARHLFDNKFYPATTFSHHRLTEKIIFRSDIYV
jgi:hypothetical protein